MQYTVRISWLKVYWAVKLKMTKRTCGFFLAQQEEHDHLRKQQEVLLKRLTQSDTSNEVNFSVKRSTDWQPSTANRFGWPLDHTRPIRGVLGLWVSSGIRRSEDSGGTEKVAWKVNSPSFNLHRDFSPGVEFSGTISKLRKRKTISTLLV